MPQFKFSRLDYFDNTELFSSESENDYFPFHFHDLFCVSLITNGTEILNNTEQEFIATSGTISITQAHEVHRNYSLDSTGYSYKTLYVNPEILKYFNNNEPITHLERVIYNPSLFKAISGLFNSTENKSKILIHCLKELTKHCESPDQKINWNNAFYKVDEIIDKHPNKPIETGWLAKQFCMSKFHFIREFKKAKGVTPQTYIMLYRLGRAKKMLLESIPIKDIAWLNGFYDTSHFSNNFKKIYGITPTHYAG
jgi:AraC-like DNA-binding protein